MIELSDVSFAFKSGGFRMDIEALAVAANERVAIVGPSGSGKTTLLNLIAGILLPNAGSVEVAGERVDQLNEANRRAFRLTRLGLVFQNFELIDYLNVLDNILFPSRIGAGVAFDQHLRTRARLLAEETGLGDKLWRKPQALSQGERQRTAICRALLLQPAVILADEATGNLDPATKREVLDLLFEQAQSVKAAVLAVTHDHELLPHFDRTIDFRDFLG